MKSTLAPKVAAYSKNVQTKPKTAIIMLNMGGPKTTDQVSLLSYPTA